MSTGRTPDQIRADIEKGRQNQAVSNVGLRGEITRFTDWRGQLRDHPEAAKAAAVAGFVIGGGIAAVGGAVFGRGRRRRRRG
jgi:hypothetical protein